MRDMMKIMASAACAAMLLSPIQAHAYDSADDFTFALRGIAAADGITIMPGDPQTVVVSPKSADEGAIVHMGIYLEAQEADLSIMQMTVTSDTEDITFVKDTFSNPVRAVYATPVEMALPDGTAFTSRYEPYAVGRVKNGAYDPDGSLTASFVSAENALYLLWNHSMQDSKVLSASFLGGRSDAYSFVEFDAAIAAGTQPGSYTVGFKKSDDPTLRVDQTPTYLSSDHSPDDGSCSVYVDMIPAMKDVQIIVAERGNVDRDDQIGARDASDVLKYSTARAISDSARLTNGTAAEEQTALYAGDVNGDGEINAVDASMILVYATEHGVGHDTSWEEIIRG